MKKRRFTRRVALSATAVIALTIGMAHAQEGASMPGMHMSHSDGQPTGAASKGFEAADKKMMERMESHTSTGDADKDFVARMIPHHQGAIDMAEVELKYGRDPKLRKLAGDIVKAQRQEIATMKRWQSEHGSK
ncbi:DUF305 domain-containing protein [Caballeronia sp. LZ032]|uniref:CopM family metallochaperone n=1 Tax=Caballeronia sp. LZ032 TaxID=3038565 RepID=UPI00285CF604|nr:DUF305 domain-containing protein [Caballeronia sp. LZ032]MDR5880531.1 DUF305 domain-containing protein [Caballeronia sp. LZ032]